jgi:hypothetical protein
MAKLPLVAIIGRPNTGKSTLFNRIVGRRIAIESEVAGTTRDHIVRKVETDEVDFLLVDTQWLRIVALIKNYNDVWVWKRLEERGEYKQEGVFEWGNKPGSWKHYLENLEKEKGTFSIYERLKSKRLSI